MAEAASSLHAVDGEFPAFDAVSNTADGAAKIARVALLPTLGGRRWHKETEVAVGYCWSGVGCRRDDGKTARQTNSLRGERPHG